MMARHFLGFQVWVRFLGSNGLGFFDTEVSASHVVAIHRVHCGATLRFAAFAKNADHRGKQRNHHYHRDYIVDFLSNIGDRAA